MLPPFYVLFYILSGELGWGKETVERENLSLLFLLGNPYFTPLCIIMHTEGNKQVGIFNIHATISSPKKKGIK